MFAKNLKVVLLVEDSPDDVDFARRALAKCGIAPRLVVAEDGDQALKLLNAPESGSAGGAPLRPALILLDLNIPGKTGRNVLRQIKTAEHLCSIPVVVLSTSSHRSDIEFCFRNHANSYHIKSDSLVEFQNTLRQIVEYWLGATVPAPVAVDTTCEPAALA